MAKRLTKKGYLSRCKKTHGNRYDYSKVEYKNNRSKVIIICSLHGEFEQNAASHVDGSGCSKCGKFKHKITSSSNTEEFIKKSMLVHGDRYDYSKSKYRLSRNKLTIICPKHGEFEQTAGNHLSGSGCNKCGFIDMVKKTSSNTEEFIKKSMLVHGGRYDYSKVQYKNIDSKVIIICSKHGEFEQFPGNHLSGSGCLLCSIDDKKYDTEEFIKKSILANGDKYDYTKVNYVSSGKKVTIICPKHGEFGITPNHHLKPTGCVKCYNDSRGCNSEDFIKKSILVHGDRYDYSKVNYKLRRKKVTIICPKHGEFEQTAGNHLSGSGCNTCNESKGEKIIRIFLIENDIRYIPEKKFNKCRNTHKLPFDFYLPNYNLCIEYDGKQHYESIKFFGGEKGLLEYKKRDAIKTKYCKDNNIPLIRIRYDEDVKTKLISELTKYNVIK